MAFSLFQRYTCECRSRKVDQAWAAADCVPAMGKLSATRRYGCLSWLYVGLLTFQYRGRHPRPVTQQGGRRPARSRLDGGSIGLNTSLC